jgi:hypothetical protein
VTVNGALEATADDLRKDLTALQVKLAIPTTQSMPGDIGPMLPADVKEPIALQDAIAALIYWSNHCVFENKLPEDVIYRSVDLQDVALRLRNLDKFLIKRRKVLAGKAKVKTKAA